MTISRRRVLASGAALLSSAAVSPLLRAQPAQTSGQPVRIGGSLSLTGPLAALGLIHKVTGEVYIADLNKRGGLLGRPVEWVLRDDQSRADVTRTLYEQLVTSEKVDLLMGPYGTASILSAMGVAQRYGKMLIHHTFGIPSLAKYDMQFQSAGVAADPEAVWPNLVLDAVASAPTPPKTIAIVTSKFPSHHFISVGARAVAKQRGLKEVLFLEWEFGNRDFGPIASRLKDANPDFIWAGAAGFDGNLLLEAMGKIDYSPRLHFYMFPAPGPMLKAPGAKNALALTTFEEHPPFTNNPRAMAFMKLYREQAVKTGVPYPAVELMASISYAAWDVLETAVNATKSLQDKALAQWLRKNHVDTIFGRLRWNGPNNYVKGTDLYKVKQVRDGKWVVVWPREYAAPGAKLIA